MWVASTLICCGGKSWIGGASQRKSLGDDRCADVITCKDFKAVDADAMTFLTPPQYDWETAIAETNNPSF